MKKIFLLVSLVTITFTLFGCSGRKKAASAYNTYDYVINDYSTYEVFYQVDEIEKKMEYGITELKLHGENVEAVKYFTSVAMGRMLIIGMYFADIPSEDIEINKITFDCNDEQYYIPTRITFTLNEDFDPFQPAVSDFRSVTSLQQYNTRFMRINNTLFENGSKIRNLKVLDDNIQLTGYDIKYVNSFEAYMTSEAYMTRREDIKEIPGEIILDSEYNYTLLIFRIEYPNEEEKDRYIGTTLYFEIVSGENIYEYCQPIIYELNCLSDSLPM